VKLWGGRFETGPAELFEQFSESLSFDQRMFEADVVGSRAFASALERVGVLSAEERSSIHEAFDRMLEKGADPAYFDGADDEDIHTFVIRKLEEEAGDVAGKIHTGRSRNEQVSTDFRLWIKKEIRAVQGRLTQVMESLLECGLRAPDALLPGYTHLRRAQGVLWPHYCLAYFEMFARDWERFEDAYRRADVLPLGSGALAGSGFPFDREAIARDLGFSKISANSLDVTADRDFGLDFLYAASTAALHVSRIAEDWILYSSEEFGFLDLGDEVTTGSSLMPQKRNPDSLELVRGKTGRVIGSLNALMVIVKGLPLAYNRDMQEDKPPVFDAADTINGVLDVLALTIDTATLRPAATEKAADDSWTSATALAEFLARSGVPFHRAHQVVGGLVLESVKQGKKPADWTLAQLQEIAPEFNAEAAELLGARRALSNHTPPGGTAPERVAEATEAARGRLVEMRAGR